MLGQFLKGLTCLDPLRHRLALNLGAESALSRYYMPNVLPANGPAFRAPHQDPCYSFGSTLKFSASRTRILRQLKHTCSETQHLLQFKREPNIPEGIHRELQNLKILYSSSRGCWALREVDGECNIPELRLLPKTPATISGVALNQAP